MSRQKSINFKLNACRKVVGMTVVTQNTTCELSVDDLTRKEIAWRVRYCGSDVSHSLEDLFRHWWAKRKLSPKWERKGREHWKQAFSRLALRIKAEEEMRRRGRCPHCGCKLKAVRCLACDLRNGVAKDEAKHT
jgi:hypothetical protein